MTDSDDPMENRSITPRRPCDNLSVRPTRGRLEVIVGPMYSGKTDELLRRVARAEIAGKNVLIFTPSTDTRSGEDMIRSHNGIERNAITVHSDECLCPRLHYESGDFIAIDEVQFLHSDAIIEDIEALLENGCTVIVAGLDMTYRREPF